MRFSLRRILLHLGCELFQVEEGWWSGTLNNKLGLFPSNFVKELELTEDGETHEGQDESGRRKKLDYDFISWNSSFECLINFS